MGGTPIDPATVRVFVAILHAQAARALTGADRPGLMQLLRIHPASESAVASRFRIGDAAGMADAALADAAAGHNVYVEARTVAEGTRGRGGKADTRGVFAFVVDSDADKGRLARLPVAPSLSVETSPGNAHHWLFLERALGPIEADALGAAIRAGVEADSDTGVITQPYRVAGTPNLPGRTKIARGRTEAVATRILTAGGPVYSLAALAAAFPPLAQARPGPLPSGRSGIASAYVTELVAEPGEDRSAQVFAAVRAAASVGMTPDDLEHLMRAHREGCAAKYLQPRDRLRPEIERAWNKLPSIVRPRLVAQPTYPGHEKPLAEAEAAVEAVMLRHMRRAEQYRSGG